MTAVATGPRATFFTSTIGKKVIMALTGVVLVGFLIVHLAGNLLVFGGAGMMDAYAAALTSKPALVWGVRVVLLLAVLLHIWGAASLTRAARAARPGRYARQVPQASTLASRSMRVGGVVLLAFIVFHLLHFTVGTVHPTYPAFEHARVYANVLVGFRVWWVVAFYVVAMIFLGLHLYHGVSAMFQSLGLSHPSYDTPRQRATRVLAALIAVGFAAIPLAVAVGALR